MLVVLGQMLSNTTGTTNANQIHSTSAKVQGIS